MEDFKAGATIGISVQFRSFFWSNSSFSIKIRQKQHFFSQNMLPVENNPLAISFLMPSNERPDQGDSIPGLASSIGLLLPPKLIK